VLAFDPQLYPDPRSTMSPLGTGNVHEALRQFGGFISMQIDVSRAWSLSGGARIASDTSRQDVSESFGRAAVLQASVALSSSHVVQPYGALMYRLNEQLSWYASYADVYLTQFELYQRADGTLLGPQHGVTFESGLKGAWREGALNASLALYRVEQRDVAAQTQQTSNNLCCYTSATGRSQGVELELDGELARRWLIGSGYTYNAYETGTPNLAVTSTPRHLLKIWTSIGLPGPLSRWTMGGSLRAQTASPGAPVLRCDAQVQHCAPGALVSTRPYAVLDLRAGYEFSPNWQVALSVGNVLDKRYFMSQNTPEFSVWYGEPRNVMLRIDAKF
jgi:outer membrane receptor for ferric coprogen and ferric-rhodotorulic acid